jgi:hypothetical protein
VDLRKQALFNEVLKKVNPDGVGKASEIADVPDLAELDDGPDEADADAEVDADAEAEEAEVEEAPPPPPPTPKPKAKAAKGKSRK